MNTILLKIHNTKQTVAEAVVVTKDGTPTTVKALKRVNYELIDQATNFAPHHIVTKRVAQDLHVSFEEDGQVTDLVIEGFYDAGDTALIGLAEDGQYYYFIPDTANASDYVTELAVGDIEGQALGGTPYAVPWWVGATEKAGFPWFGLLAGIGGIIALDDDDDKGNRGTDNGNNTNPTPPTPTPTNTTIPEPTIDTPNGSAIVTPSSSQHDCMVIEYFDEADVKQRIVVEKKGTVWEVAETSVQPISTTPTTDGKTLSIDTQTGIVTIPALAVKDNSKITAHHGIFNLDTPDPTDKISGKDIEGQVGDNPAQNQPTPPTNPPTQTTLTPVVFTQVPNGMLSFSLIKNTTATKAVATFIAPDDSTRNVEFTKDIDGSWKSNDSSINHWKVETVDVTVATLDTKTQKIVTNVPAVRFVIPANEVKDHKKITVVVTDNANPNNVLTYTAEDTANSADGKVGDESIDITPPVLTLAGSATGNTVELTYNKTLDNIAIANERFTVQADGQSITINSVKIDMNKVVIELKDPVVVGKTIKLSYDDPTNNDDPVTTSSNPQNPVQDVAGNDAPEISTLHPLELTVGSYLAQSDTIDFGLIGDVNIIDLGVVANASLLNVTHANVTDSKNDGLFIKGDVGDTITLGTVLDTGSSAIQTDTTGSWEKGATETVNNNVYDIWKYTDGITLYIDADMTVL